MRVDDRNLNGSSGLQPKPASPVPETGQTESEAETRRVSSGGDRAEISSGAATISRALSAHRTERAQQIALLAREYAAGRYQPNPQSTSRALIKDSVEAADDRR